MSVIPIVPPKKKTPAKGRPNVAAIVAFIEGAMEWQRALRFNELTSGVECCDQFPPQPQKSAQAQTMRSLRDPADLLEALVYFQRLGFAKAGKQTVWDALLFVAHQHRYHPVRDYLDSLQWDGTPRVSALFLSYFNAELPADKTERARHIAYLEHTSRSLMVAAVARAKQPGCKFDHVPMLVGQERLLKSTAIRALCADPTWFSDNLPPDLGERDTKEALTGKWIIELSEIPHIRRESERVKAFFSC
jgi:predicted P-loop ATPase